MRRALLLLTLAIVLAPACKKDRDSTKIVVAVWSDLAVPSELDEIRIEVVGPTQTGMKTFPLTGPGMLPVLFELVPIGDKNATFAVKAVGLRSLVEVVSQTARVSFASGKALVLKLFLGRDCRGKNCTGDYTCAQGVCSQPITVGTLPPYDPNNLQGPDAGARQDSSIVSDTGLTPDSSGSEPVAPDLRAVDSSAREAGAEAFPDVPIISLGTGGAGGRTGFDGPGSSGGAGGSTGLRGSGGTTSVDASTWDIVATDAADAPLSGGAGGGIGGAGGAIGTGGATSGTGGAGGTTGGGGETGTGGAMEACVFGTSRFGNCKFGP